jgi:hypothetical protein
VEQAGGPTRRDRVAPNMTHLRHTSVATSDHNALFTGVRSTRVRSGTRSRTRVVPRPAPTSAGMVGSSRRGPPGYVPLSVRVTHATAPPRPPVAPEMPCPPSPRTLPRARPHAGTAHTGEQGVVIGGGDRRTTRVRHVRIHTVTPRRSTRLLHRGAQPEGPRVPWVRVRAGPRVLRGSRRRGRTSGWDGSPM